MKNWKSEARRSPSGKSLRLLAAAGLAALLSGCASLEKQALELTEKIRSTRPETENAFPPEVRIPPAGTPVTPEDLAGLPDPVRRYFEQSGVLGKPRINSFSAVLTGRIRNSGESGWMPLKMRQYNRLDLPARVVYIESRRPLMAGVDSYTGGSGRMVIRLLNLVTLEDSRGPEMDRSGLVTFLNDLTFCPLACFSLPLVWTGVDENRAELSLTLYGTTVRALLTFDALGRIANWESTDRYASVKGRNLPDRWSTPFDRYGEAAGMSIPVAGRGVHDYDGRPYDYIELQEIRSLRLDPPGLPSRRD